MKLDRPLVWLDLETTGVEIGRDRIVQIACLKTRPDGSEKTWQTLLNPRMPVGESTKVHGITDEMLKDAPEWGVVAPGLLEALRGCDVAGFGIRRFDVPFLRSEFRRVGLEWDVGAVCIVDAMAIFHLKRPRNLAAAVKEYSPDTIFKAHDAMEDCMAARMVLDGQLAAHDDLPRDVAALADFCADGAVDLEGKLKMGADGAVCINFGKHRGRALVTLARVEPGFLDWMLRSDFDETVKACVSAAIESVANERGAE